MRYLFLRALFRLERGRQQELLWGINHNPEMGEEKDQK
jgi:hypothetical protein